MRKRIAGAVQGSSVSPWLRGSRRLLLFVLHVIFQVLYKLLLVVEFSLISSYFLSSLRYFPYTFPASFQLHLRNFWKKETADSCLPATLFGYIKHRQEKGGPLSTMQGSQAECPPSVGNQTAHMMGNNRNPSPLTPLSRDNLTRNSAAMAGPSDTGLMHLEGVYPIRA